MMRRWREHVARVAWVFRKRDPQGEPSDESRPHAERRSQPDVERGRGVERARQVAWLTSAGVAQTQDPNRKSYGVRFIGEFVEDIRHGLRVLAKAPGFSGVVILTLALGVGATTAVFSVVDQVLLRPMPFPDPDRLVTLWNVNPAAIDTLEEVSPPDFCDWRDQSRSFENLAAFERYFYVLAGDPAPMRLRAVRVSKGFFAALGVRPAIGRWLLPADDRPGHHRVVVLSHGLWTRQFGADPSIIGQTITLSGSAFAVVGVMPQRFEYPGDVDLWSPMAAQPPFDPSDRSFVWLHTIGRLAPGVTIANAQSDVSAIARRLEQTYPATNRERGVRVVSLHEHTVGGARRELVVLQAAVALLLLISCINVVHLLLSRAASRQREVVTRLALGAGRFRVLRQLVTENAIVGMASGGAGTLLALFTLEAFRALDPVSVPRLQEVQLDWRCLCFAFAVAILSAVVSGLAPAASATSADLQSVLGAASSRVAGNRGRRRWRAVLIASEIALANVLLVGAGLLVQSFVRVSRVAPGFEPRGLVVGQFELNSKRYQSRTARTDFYRAVVGRVSGLPGVQTAALATTIPFHSGQLSLLFSVGGRSVSPSSERLHPAGYNSVTPEYFRAMRIRLRSGRTFTDRDDADAPPVAVINQATARRFWGGRSPLGDRIWMEADEQPREIVGVVDDVRQVGLAADVRFEVYLPYAQRPWSTCYLLVRSERESSDLAASLRAELLALDRMVALSDVRPLTDHLSASLTPPRFRSQLLGVFALLALTLAVVGVFGVVSFAVSQRTREFAVRVALGAAPHDISRLVIGRGLWLALSGVAVGSLLSFACARLLTSWLFDIVPTDPPTYVAVAVLLGGAAIAASYAPCRRASTVDPVRALRNE